MISDLYPCNFPPSLSISSPLCPQPETVGLADTRARSFFVVKKLYKQQLKRSRGLVTALNATLK